MPANPASGAGMGNATVAMRNPASIFTNQAGLAGLQHLALTATAERRFLLSELQSASVGAVLPTRSGTFGISAQTFGFEGFLQQKIGLACARKLWESLFAGVQFDYFQTRIPEYGSKNTVTFEAGIQAVIAKGLVIGAHVFNPAPIELADGENLPAIFRLGLAWQASEKVTLATEIEKDIDFPYRWKSGLEYRPGSSIFLRTGFATDPSTFHLGVGFAFGNGLQADMASSFHQTLGLTPSAGVVYQKRK
ncbi:MAG: hypothetical protein HY842_05030 [Bacteroidetes bacterium]|nr:hypothetical protein [Bacteroidota bacterium]